MTQNISYNTFISRLDSLKKWDPNSQLLTQDLQLRTKPTSLDLCSLIKLAFSHSRAKDAVAASNTLYSWTKQFEEDLKADEQTLLKVRAVNAKIYGTFVAGGEKKHTLRSRSRRKKIENNFFRTRKVINKKKGINSASKINKFLEEFDPQSVKEAISGYKKINSFVDALTRKQANDLLIHLREIKKNFKQNGEFSKAHLEVCKNIRAKFFAERLHQNREDLEALLDNFEGSETGKVFQILERWTERLEKNKPISIPKWYHCTKSQYINSLISSGKIAVRHKGAYKGAFVSNQPEANFGPYCIALDSNIESEAKKPPRITWAQGQITIGSRPSPKNKQKGKSCLDQAHIWAGFKENIVFTKPKKTKDPLGYYERTNLSLVGQADDLSKLDKDDVDAAWLGLSSKVQADLKARKVELLQKNDFDELVRLIAETFECHVPHAWKDAKGLSS